MFMLSYSWNSSREVLAGCVSSVITVERCLREGVALPVVTTWDNNPTQSTGDWTNTTRSIIRRPAYDRSQFQFLDFTFISISYLHFHSVWYRGLPVVATWDNNPTESTSDWTNTTRSIIWRPAHNRSQFQFLDFTFI